MSKLFSIRLAKAHVAQRLTTLLFLLMLLLHLLLISARAAGPLREAGEKSEAAESSPDALQAPVEEEAEQGENQEESQHAETGDGVPPAAQQADTFPVKRFVIYGYSRFPRETLKALVDDLTGPARTAADVQAARDRLEKYYHDNGYPTTFVNIPEQSVASGFVYLQIIEGKVGKLTVKGAGWIPESRIREAVPSLAEGEVISLQAVSKDMGRANSIPDVKVTPAMSPGKETGTTDVELKVEDRMPLHGSIELSNRNSLNTSSLRLNAMLRYDDLWKLGHSVSFQYQTSPQNMSQVQVFSGSYTLPAPWSDRDRLVLYGVRSDSESGFGEGFKTLGNGSIVGIRYIKPFSPLGAYNHYATFGFDYKDFRETGETATTVTYLPFSLAYGAALADPTGTTRFSAGLSFAFRGMVTDNTEFGVKRSEARGNYIIFTPGVERAQRLPAGMELRLKLDGQISDQPLISNEQYAAGGMESVRGYYESEISGDSAFHASVELAAPDLAAVAGMGGKAKAIPYVFFDYAALHVKKPLPEQTASFNLQGAGLGIRGMLLSFLEFQVDGAFALRDAGNSAGSTKKGDSRVMFRVKGQW